MWKLFFLFFYLVVLLLLFFHSFIPCIITPYNLGLCHRPIIYHRHFKELQTTTSMTFWWLLTHRLVFSILLLCKYTFPDTPTSKEAAQRRKQAMNKSLQITASTVKESRKPPLTVFDLRSKRTLHSSACFVMSLNTLLMSLNALVMSLNALVMSLNMSTWHKQVT